MGPRQRLLLLLLVSATLRTGAVGVMEMMSARPAPEASALALFGRLGNAALGVAATYLVLRLARRVVDRRSAWAAAWIHAVLPTSLFFAASLRAEPVVVALMLLTVETVLVAGGSPPGRPRLLRVVAAAVFLCLLVPAFRMMASWGAEPWPGSAGAVDTVVGFLDRLRTVWAADLAPTRHAAAVLHHPVPIWAGAGRWLVQVALWLGVTSLAVKGLLRREAWGSRRALLIPVGLGSLAAAWFGAGPEAHHPLLALLLPAAGAGWAHRGEPMSTTRQLRAAAVMGGVAWLTTSSLAGIIETRLMPSAWTRPWVEPVARIAGADPVYADLVEVRCSREAGGVIVDASPEEPTAFLPGGGERTYLVGAGVPHAKGLLILKNGPSGSDVVIDPVDADWWGRWRPLDDFGLPGVEIRWLGGGPNRSGIAEFRDLV